MKIFKNSFYGFMAMVGFLFICCDTDTPCQLIAAILFGFGLLLLGGRLLILNNRRKS